MDRFHFKNMILSIVLLISLSISAALNMYQFLYPANVDHDPHFQPDQARFVQASVVRYASSTQETSKDVLAERYAQAIDVGDEVCVSLTSTLYMDRNDPVYCYGKSDGRITRKIDYIDQP